MSNIQFAKGVNIKSVQTAFGEILKVGINFAQFTDNPIKDSGWLNLDFKKSKNGNWYAEINNYQANSDNAKKNIVNFDEIPEEEIPF